MHGFIYKMLRKKNIVLNGKKSDGKEKLNVGDSIKIFMADDTILKFRGEIKLDIVKPIDLDIVYEDQDVIVVNKPSGMIVHPSAGIYSGTLVNALLYHCKDLSGINGVNRPGIVHRIDKETSGLLMVAKNDKAHQSLSEQLKEHSVTRRYVALVHGVIPHTHGKVNAPIGRDYLSVF